MKFLGYWFVSMMLTVMAMFERMVCELQGHEYSFLFWIIIGIAGFFWLCGYGDIQESKNNKKPPTQGTDTSNPF